MIIINGKVEAFTLGEILNGETTVVHIEKANPEIPQAFVVINQQFCEHEWPDVKFIDREQDLVTRDCAKQNFPTIRSVWWKNLKSFLSEAESLSFLTFVFARQPL